MTDATELVEVKLLGLPLDTLAEAQEHGDELRREFQHIASPEGDSDAVPDRLLALSERLSGEYGGYTAPADSEIEAAAERGEKSIDLAMRVPASAAEAARALWVLLDEVDEYCRQGDMLTLAPPPALVRLRHWYLGEFINQIAGSPPVAWPEYEG